MRLYYVMPFRVHVLAFAKFRQRIWMRLDRSRYGFYLIYKAPWGTLMNINECQYRNGVVILSFGNVLRGIWWKIDRGHSLVDNDALCGIAMVRLNRSCDNASCSWLLQIYIRCLLQGCKTYPDILPHQNVQRYISIYLTSTRPKVIQITHWTDKSFSKSLHLIPLNGLFWSPWYLLAESIALTSHSFYCKYDFQCSD